MGVAQEAATSPEYGTAWQELTDALREAVPHHVCGKATSGANGLSIWYPISATAQDVSSYLGISPLATYASALSQLYLQDFEPIEFFDAGSIGKDGALTVTIDPMSAESFFDLYVVNRRKDGTYAYTNVDIYDDWDNLTFVYDPSKAVAITLDGMPLDASVVGYGDGYQTFSSPVQVDGRTTNLRTSWMRDDKDGGRYQILGTWDGIDGLTGMADRSFGDLDPDADVAAITKETDDIRDYARSNARKRRPICPTRAWRKSRVAKAETTSLPNKTPFTLTDDIDRPRMHVPYDSWSFGMLN